MNMGIFDRKDKRSNAVQVNDVNKNLPMVFGWNWFPRKKGYKPFAEVFVQMCLNQLYNGVSNLTFETTHNSVYASNICAFIDSNSTLIVNMWLNKGFVCVMYNDKGEYRFPEQNELRFDQFGRVVNMNSVVIYSPVYQTKKKSYMQIVKPVLELIDNLGNTISESTNTMGVLPVISGNSIPANPKFKEELAHAMTKEYGWGEDQLRYFLSQQELKVDSIDMKVKDLELRANLESAFKYILDFFEVPVDLVIGNSTYANVESAKLYFYESTIRKYAEVMLKVARALLTASPELLLQNTITYRISNVAGIDRSLSGKCSERESYIDLLIKLRDNGIDTDEELAKVYADLQRDYIES